MMHCSVFVFSASMIPSSVRPRSRSLAFPCVGRVCTNIIDNSCKRIDVTQHDRTSERNSQLETSYDKTESLLQLATAFTTPAPFPSLPAAHVFRRGRQVPFIGEDGGATVQGCVHKFDCTECTFTMTASSLLAIFEYDGSSI
jgi:hypothetical protein